MATPTYWADKLVNKIFCTRSSRRAFLKATTAAGLSVSALGAIDVLSGYSGVQSTQDKNTDLQKEIYALKWGPSNPENIERLIAILDKGVSAKDSDLTRASAEGLTPHAGEKVFDKLVETFRDKAISDDVRLQQHLLRLIIINISLNQATRRKMGIFFNATAWAALPVIVKRIGYSGEIFIGNMLFRVIRRLIRRMRLENDSEWILFVEYWFGYMAQLIYPPYNALERYTPEELEEEWMFRLYGGWVDYTKPLKELSNPKKSAKWKKNDEMMFANPEQRIPLWRKQLLDKDPGKIKLRIDALLNIDERDERLLKPNDPDEMKILLEMLEDKSEPPEMKRAVVAIMGTAHRVEENIQTLLVEYLNSLDKELALAAAKALRFKEKIYHPERILDNLAQIKDVDFMLQLGEEILSSLDSPAAFNFLAWSFFITDSKNIEGRIKRARELRIWYLKRGNNRDEILRQAISSVPEEVREIVQEWLRNISLIHIWTPMPPPPFVQSPNQFDGQMFFETGRLDAIAEDTKKFEQIAKKLGFYDKNMGIVDRE